MGSLWSLCRQRAVFYRALPFVVLLAYPHTFASKRSGLAATRHSRGPQAEYDLCRPMECGRNGNETVCYYLYSPSSSNVQRLITSLEQTNSIAPFHGSLPAAQWFSWQPNNGSTLSSLSRQAGGLQKATLRNVRG